ncbi:P-loop containing nucleoside triphosphate hydrolase protein [Hyaloraphidium curvatum]|nr:P-loop containing nucleoside triphosphate hydrolase protein [Hyaloraphidium curvatum]
MQLVSTRLSAAQLDEARGILAGVSEPPPPAAAEPRAERADARPPTFEAFARIRPFSPGEAREWNSALPRGGGCLPGFAATFPPESRTADVFKRALEPHVAAALAGGAVTAFCHGHTGAGKTHTALGAPGDPGLFELAASALLAGLAPGLALHARFLELYGAAAFDLLDARKPVHLREARDGSLRVRGETRLLGDGRVAVLSQRREAVRTGADAARVLAAGCAHRSAGASSVHDRSSRSHAVLELEVVSEELVRARDAVAEAEAVEVQAGKAAADGTMAFWAGGLLAFGGAAGHRTAAPSCDADGTDPAAWLASLRAAASIACTASRIALAAQQSHDAARAREAALLSSPRPGAPAVGGKITLVDLAGADRDHRTVGTDTTPRERAESAAINRSLMAVRACIRALATGEGRPPFRDAPLARVLAPALLGTGAATVVVACVSPCGSRARETRGTLEYARMAAGAAEKGRAGKAGGMGAREM